MRRPLKPFVTEYKGSRRASPPFGEPAPVENERPAPKLAEARPRPEPEDSYEAAMRAADALFSAPVERKVEAHGKQQENSGQPHTDAPSERNGGRILRVIDEAPPPQFAALEAEFAPKRRGRKPGSKNKPKMPALTPAFEPQAVDHALTVSAAVPQHVTAPAQRQVVALSDAPPAPRGEKRYPWVRDRLKPGEDWKRRRLPRVCW